MHATRKNLSFNEGDQVKIKDGGPIGTFFKYSPKGSHSYVRFSFAVNGPTLVLTESIEAYGPKAKDFLQVGDIVHYGTNKKGFISYEEQIQYIDQISEIYRPDYANPIWKHETTIYEGNCVKFKRGDYLGIACEDERGGEVLMTVPFSKNHVLVKVEYLESIKPSAQSIIETGDVILHKAGQKYLIDDIREFPFCEEVEAVYRPDYANPVWTKQD